MDDDDDEEAALERPYLFYVGEEEVKATLVESLKRVIVNRERTLPIIYKPQASGRPTNALPATQFQSKQNGLLNLNTELCRNIAGLFICGQSKTVVHLGNDFMKLYTTGNTFVNGVVGRK